MLTRHADRSPVRETQRAPMELMLQSLPTQNREIIVATYFQGRTTREAARVLGLAGTEPIEAAYRVAGEAAAEVALVPLATMVEELRAPGGGKDAALARFMADAAFRGAQPIAVGDDLTDEAMFVAAPGPTTNQAKQIAARHRGSLTGLADPRVESVQ